MPVRVFRLGIDLLQTGQCLLEPIQRFGGFPLLAELHSLAQMALHLDN